MKWFSERWQEINCRYQKGFRTCIVCLVLLGISTMGSFLMIRTLYDQQASVRWSEDAEYAQLSCFYPISITPSEFEFQSLYHSIEEALKAASITAEKEQAKLFVDAYSVSGTLSLYTQEHEMEVTAIGVSDNFFLFHPMDLLEGSYFDDEMIMKDGVILDEEAAFRLYGSNDVVGMPVYIGNEPYYIRGVVAREDGYFAKKAGLSSSVCYVSIGTLEEQGSIEGSYTYEVLMPNPVDGFAKETLTASLNDAEGMIEVVENSNRFSVDAKKEIVLDFGVRSMSRNSIIYPYWENIARATEDICGVLFVVQVVTFVIVAVLVVRYLWKLYKNRTWTIRTGIEKIQNLRRK